MADVNFSANPTSEASMTAALSVISVALISASAITEARALATLTGGNASLQGAASTAATATANLFSSSAIGLQATATTEAVATSRLIGGNQALLASAITEATATSELIGGTVLFGGAAITECEAVSELTGASDLRGRTLCELVRESLSLWGFLCAKNAPGYAKARAVTDVNTALQLIWNNADGHNYWSNETLTLTLDDGEDSIDLPDTIQNVVGPCRREDNNQPLTPIGTIGELGTFADLYLDGAALAYPVAYHVERLNQAGDEPARCILHVTPAVSGASVNFLLEVVKEPPRYTVSDLATCPAIPIPHRYAETLLIPIIRYNASSYYLFEALDPKQKETIDREYHQAMISLGLADPNPAKEVPARKEGKA